MNTRAFLTFSAPLALAGAAAAQQTWVPLVAGVPAGKPAELRFVPGASNTFSTTLELEIFGYWSEPVVGPDNVAYRRLTFPGMGELGQTGAPELPAMRTRLAVATDVMDTTLLGVSVAPGDQQSFSMTLYPEPIPALDGGDPGPGDPNGSPEVFQKDAAIYATNASFPTLDGTPIAPVRKTFGAIPTSLVELFPVDYNPVAKKLVVNRLTTYSFRHEGTPVVAPPLTLDKLALAEASCPNWPTAAPWIQGNSTSYDGRYLIVTPEAYLDALETFIQYRKSTGYAVTVITLESLPFVTCGEIRGAIDTWYQAGAANFDHYCLLVGDVDVIPFCPSATPGLIDGDDRYGSPGGIGDLDEEVFVGRLSVDNAAGVTHQTTKIIDYETDATATHDYGDVVLVAHKEDAPGKYVGAQEEVANAAYVVQPSFVKRYGSVFGVDNTDVLADIDMNVGLVAYRGHGSTNTWSGWNLTGENFHKDSIGPLTNSQRPVVWSFSCTNANLNWSDCIAETWLEASDGAVAHYGSTVASGTSKNHTLDKKMFEAVFTHGLTTHGQAIAWAEDQMELLHPNSTWQNAWMYLLLGDPAMKVRRNKPKQLDLVLPPVVPVCPIGSPCFLTVQVVDGGGNPLPGVLVTAYKESFPPGGPDEIFFTGYTGTGGTTVVPGPTELGSINVTGRDDDGNVVTEVTAVESGAFTSLGNSLPGGFGAAALTSTSTLDAGTPVTLSLSHAAPNSPGLMAVGFVDSAVPLFGGIVHPLPSALDVPVTTNFQGEWTYDIPLWPGGLPPGLKLYWQVGMLDFGAVQDVALSNALRSTQP
ncbi:C25 family cysteine peptidase [Engelhardtia mirabilis]|uniref:Gingipain R2 n=1 Tax=Engelhardtia mirabilis TaxID=2528011 RepID=A0A518BS16_9BACT|nr:Gingipain R2 precursor [Planctomycetes bacterium Pla133]QDV04098.1 Gingipain R2 precursor [Planctomycetes bacterium Pla86]